MSAAWAKLETHVVDGVFPLQRVIGSTEHSGVFLTQSAEHAPADLALKLISLDTKSAKAQLERWRAATRLSHPHLLRIFQVGVCQLDGAHYLYVLMEYADQTLAQLLERRALTEDEAREMLAPMLDALEYLHRAHLAQGAVKPSNILVVGDQLKLASDTVRVIGSPDAGAAAEDDVHALGATLCEALTRIRPESPQGSDHAELPGELPDSFNDVVARCSSPDPRARPTLAALKVWLGGEPLVVNPPAPEPAPTPALAPAPAPAPASRPSDTADPASHAESEVAAVPAQTNRRALPWVIGALAVVALLWIGYRWIGTAAPSAQPAPPPVEAPPPATAAAPAVVEPPPEQPAAPTGIATNEVMPAVSQSSLDTVRGTLRVAIRVSVNKAGRVVAATTDDAGPSRYFERRALEASKQWTFVAADTNEQRSLRIRFAFTRAGVTASASPLP